MKVILLLPTSVINCGYNLEFWIFKGRTLDEDSEIIESWSNYIEFFTNCLTIIIVLYSIQLLKLTIKNELSFFVSD